MSAYIWCKTAIQTLKLPLKLSQWHYTVEEINYLLSNKILKKHQTQNMYAKHVHVSYRHIVIC